MHPYDRENPPQGAGWVVEIIGHHYNPMLRENLRESGPYFFLATKVLPRFWELAAPPASASRTRRCAGS